MIPWKDKTVLAVDKHQQLLKTRKKDHPGTPVTQENNAERLKISQPSVRKMKKRI